MGTLVAKVLGDSAALQCRLEGMQVDCHAVAERGEVAMLELAANPMAPVLPYIIFKAQNASKMVEAVSFATRTNTTKEGASLGQAIKGFRVLLGCIHAVSVVFTEVPKADPGDVPGMLVQVKKVNI